MYAFILHGRFTGLKWRYAAKHKYFKMHPSRWPKIVQENELGENDFKNNGIMEIFTIQEMVGMLFAINDWFCSNYLPISTDFLLQKMRFFA
jgi:hypothetical protein